LRKLRKESTGSFVFVSERGAPFTPASFNWMIKRACQKAGLLFQVHAHMLRHSAGYKLAGDGHDTRSIQTIWVKGHSAHGPLHGAFPQAVPGFLVRLS
jgi:site-specific recombinase XerD